MSVTKTAAISLSVLALVLVIILQRYQLISDLHRAEVNRPARFPAYANAPVRSHHHHHTAGYSAPMTRSEVNDSGTANKPRTTARTSTILKTVISTYRRDGRLKFGVSAIFGRKPARDTPCSHFLQFDYLINCAETCSRSRHPLESPAVFLLNYVHSAVANFARRARVRSSWGLRSNYPRDRVETVFFVGLPSGHRRLAIQASVEAESLQFGDIVQVNVVDTYRNMTVKALAALDWITKYCGDARYFLKADDDAFVNEFATLKHLRDLESAGFRRRLLVCLAWHRPAVARRGKWAVPPAEFAGARYPTYCCGLGYLVTGDVVRLLLSAAAAATSCHAVHRSHARRNPVSDDDVTAAANFPRRSDVTDAPVADSDNDVTGISPPSNVTRVTDGGDVGEVPADDDVIVDVTGNSSTYDVTGGRIFWIDDVYVTGLLVEALGGRIRHADMSAAFCKSDKMAAVYRHVTEWYKYLFTHVGDDEAQLYRETWKALRQRASTMTIPSPSVVKPGRLADHYIPLSVMLQLARNATLTTT